MNERLNEGQLAAFEEVKAWFHDPVRRKEPFFLSGPGGSGKTTLIESVVEYIDGLGAIMVNAKGEIVSNGKVIANGALVVAYTGKAVSRLRQNAGCKRARTIHGAFLDFIEEDGDDDPVFGEKGEAVGGVAPRLIIVDEASMVRVAELTVMQKARIKTNPIQPIPILAVGDVNQLPPVKSKRRGETEKEHQEANRQSFTKPDFSLTQVMRTTGPNILMVANAILNGLTFIKDTFESEDLAVRYSPASDEDILEHTGGKSMIVCHKNELRDFLNGRARALLGRNSRVPEIGEKVCCTFNQHDFGVMNGEIFEVERYRPPVITDKAMREWLKEKFLAAKRRKM